MNSCHRRPVESGQWQALDMLPSAPKRRLTHFLVVLAISSLLVFNLSLLTNRMSVEWDMKYYLDMAVNGIAGNTNLAAPFAYRPAAPLMVGGIAYILHSNTEDIFRICGEVFCVVFVISSFYYARAIGANGKSALFSGVILALYFYIVKWTLFSGTMVDIYAYPLMLLAFWALIRERFYLCLYVSAIGLFVKEFMLLPLLTQAVMTVVRVPRHRWRKLLIPLRLTGIVFVVCFGIPRLVIHVAQTFQDLDPINERSTLRRLLLYPLSRKHDFNILFAYLACWLPVVLFLNRERWRIVWSRIRPYRYTLGIFMAFHFLLVMYGGTNLDIYPTYCVPIQIMFLVCILDEGHVPYWEWIAATILVILFNRLWMPVPLPRNGLDAYLDFYTGYYMRVTPASFWRMGELLAYIFGFWTIRSFVDDGSSRRHAGQSLKGQPNQVG